MKRLLYYAPESYGGLLNYAQEQADALAGAGVNVTVLCSPRFVKRANDRYAVLPKLMDSPMRCEGNKLRRSLRFLRRLFCNLSTLRQEIERGGYKYVMFTAYAEYFAPLWARSFRRLARTGVVFGSVVQEPVRDFRVGPEWWHRLSIKEAYSFLAYAFMHDEVVLDTVAPMRNLETVVIPYGPHQFPDPTEERNAFRKRLKIPKNAVLLLAFGHIRDNKNLDFSVRALKEIPEAFLLVAGKRNASSQRPEQYYIELADSLGVSDRCRWFIDYISEGDAANFFTASDLVLLTYNSSFRSASGVLHLAARYRKQSLVSAGRGSLQSVLSKHRIGLWIEPDVPEAVASGVRNWMNDPPQPDWEGYRRDNSWDRNAKLVIEAMQGNGRSGAASLH